MDLDNFEEDCCLEVGCVIMDESEDGAMRLCAIQKSGGGFVNADMMISICEVAQERWREWRDTLQKALERK